MCSKFVCGQGTASVALAGVIASEALTKTPLDHHTFLFYGRLSLSPSLSLPPSLPLSLSLAHTHTHTISLSRTHNLSASKR